MAKRVAKFVLCETFADVVGEGAVDDFEERLLVDVPERNLTAVVEAASDNSAIVENRYVRV